MCPCISQCWAHRDGCTTLGTQGWLQPQQQSDGHTGMAAITPASCMTKLLTSVTKQVCLFLFQAAALFLSLLTEEVC